MKVFFTRFFLLYLFRFCLAFCFLYLGTIGVIGLSSPGGYHSQFIQNYFNYVSWLRYSLINTSRIILSLFRYKTNITGIYTIKLIGGNGVRIVYSCLGYGIMSFWAAFVFANKAGWLKKISWILGGWLIIWCINVARISLLLLAINRKRPLPLNLDNHTLFNAAAYTAIFILIYYFDRSQKNKSLLKQGPNNIAD